MFQGRLHKNYAAVQSANQAQSGNVESFGNADFWYDASAGRYFTPTSLATGGTTTGWQSRFSNGTFVPTSGFGPTYGGNTYSLPNLMVAGKAPIASATKNTNPVTATQGINIGEFLVYSSALGDSQIAALNTYLKNKWLGTN